MSKISAYAALTSPASGDVLPVVDVSDTSMAASGTTKKITIANLAAVDWLNVVTQFGADPTGAADSTTAIQNAINAAAFVSASDASGILGAAQATVYIPGGTYLISSGPLVLTHGHSLRITGAGDGTILKSTANAIIDFDGLNGLTEGSVEIDHLGFDAAGGHVFQNPNLHGQLHLHDLAIRQRSAGFSVFWADDTVTGHSTGLYQAIFRNIRYTLDAGTRSVEAWHIVSNHSDGFTDLTWEHISGPVPSGYTGNDASLDNTQYQWYVTCTGATANHMSNLTWRDCIMSNAFGGIVKAAAQQNLLIEKVSAYNTFDRAITNSSFWLTKDPVNNGPVQGAVIRNCFRTNALGSGSPPPPYDVLLDSACKNVLIENVVTGYSPAVTFINIGGASGVVVVQPGGGGAASVPVISNQAADTVVIGQGAVTDGGGTLGAGASGQRKPADYGLIAWTQDMITAAGSTSVVNGTVYFAQVGVPSSQTLTRLLCYVQAGAVTPASAQCWMAIYDSAGAGLLGGGAVDVSAAANLTGGGLLTATLSAPFTALGNYQVALLFNAATPPKLMNGNNTSGGAVNWGLTTTAILTGKLATGSQTTMPASFAAGGGKNNAPIPFIVGVS